ncbi:MAG: 1,4-alpha-glucan branching protein domain-containing protein [Bacillota bacterium]
MFSGYLSILLHAHLPFVRHPEHSDSLEERWFFESCTECYIPLLSSFERLADDGVEFRLTISLSPTLLSMMTDDLLKEKYLSYLDRMISLGLAECERTSGNAEFNTLSEIYLRHLENVRRYFNGCGGDIASRFKELSARGRLELITTAATHGFLPLIHNGECRRAQVEVGLGLFGKLFGQTPPGFWLPECAYDKGLDVMLKESGVKYFIVDTHGLLAASPEPVYGVYGPLHCRSGVAVFGRDPESSRQVWERRVGYPGHPDYREFYRDIAYDLDPDYLKPYLPDGSVRVDTGFKYYRITGRGEHKETYKPDLAGKRAEIHARDFVGSRIRQLGRAHRRMDRTPVILAPYDAELFGHWWYEGPAWLENVLRLAALEKRIKTISPGDYLSMYPDNRVADLPMSSWGEGGYSYVWLNPKNDWIYRHQHVAEARMTEMADRHRQAGGLVRRALNQAGRELLLAQSSDWAFILKEETTVGYATQRVTGHIKNFLTLAEQIDSGSIDESFINELESADNIFPDLDFKVFGTRKFHSGPFRRPGMRVIMLSWEYPPRTVGGLGRHVHDLSRALSGLGVEVHVFTCPARDKPLHEVDDAGVCVHRVNPEELDTGDFLEWLARLNAGMVKRAEETGLSKGYFSLVHAHDWLVRDAARTIGERYGLPLVATIHATEYGRNRGIFTDLQRRIHSIEGDLVARASQVICCSHYMAREVGRLFGKRQGEIKVIPNGVDAGNLAANSAIKAGFAEGSGGPVIAFLGRLVPEKGVQVLIQALPMIRRFHPGAVLVVAGRGPFEDELKRLAGRLGVAGHVNFIGFVDDAGRNRLLAEASVAAFPSIYEPFGIVALEAMAAGTPVVISDTGGLSEIISHGIDGLKVPPGRADLLARFVVELLSRPALAEKLGRKAYRKVVSRYDWNQIAFETARVYTDVGRRVRGKKKISAAFT